MTKLFIRVPPRICVDASAGWLSPEFSFALVSAQGLIEQEGRQPLADFANVVAQAQQVVLLIAASDVTLLRIAVPPLSSAKLKAALPHLVEDQLISDPAECVIVAGPRVDGMRAIAVMQRDWLELLTTALVSMGARAVRALPAQLCLPLESNAASATFYHHDTQLELTIRMSEHAGIGLSALPDAASLEAVAMLRVLMPKGPIKLHVPTQEFASYTALLRQNEPEITVMPDAWPHWIIAANACQLDLIAGLSLTASGQGINLRPWRWPLILASAVLLLNVVALNLDWWQLRSESLQVKSSMLNAYRSAYPKETVIVDPIAQTRLKIDASQLADGQLAPDNFIVLAAQFNTAWHNLGKNAGKSSVASIEYHDRSLFVRLANPGDNDAMTDRLKNALAGNRLALSQPSTGLWQIKFTGDKQ